MIDIPAGGPFCWSRLIVVFVTLGSAACSGNYANAQSGNDPIPAATLEHASLSRATATPAIGRTTAEADPSSTPELQDAPNRADYLIDATSESSPIEFEGSGRPDRYASVISTRRPGYVSLDQCPDDFTHARSCRVHWQIGRASCRERV